MDLCQRCGKREYFTVIGGRKLCSMCGKDEIVKRVRKEMHQSKLFNYNDRVAIISPEPLQQISDIVESIIGKAFYRVNLKIEKVEISISNYNYINEYMWNLLLESKKLSDYKIKVLPFTSNFFLAYMLESISISDYSYLSLFNPYSIIDTTIIFIPLYSTPIQEIECFSKIDYNKIKFKDELFNTIFDWVNQQLRENYELFHTYFNTINLFRTDNKCKNCGAYINSGQEYCERCKTYLASPSHLYLK
ncbi:hypothetical protein [Sulfolobus acidocaldarius]|uniref:Conserved protein n=3 Tax=Sulfolobus acidocaldarius TaxID=2285 RepID=Q4J8Z9_SULAC|nr:hypothetical protein [Sulfolobus acidocaldarius]AAY80732.1 conserved protein [Sulfolobus acidocaldarius DSM 639]AGE71329.1 hypothetical protein SacN8_06825 [Sulfolobus acidocaldarius N8]AGE73598.1 hypothetical protein SacRon12I_06815 [Sulfolobus acidocaldarius Ron12/I]WCM35242.1 hypothetical protein GO597_07870 [Sulfolobus acidocaldarius DSM 639]